MHKRNNIKKVILVSDILTYKNQASLDFEEAYLSTKLPPIIKWAGGKENELKYIIPNLPANIERFFDPFVGGGSVFLSVRSEKKFINDKSSELINLYKVISSNNNQDFIDVLDKIDHNWKVLEVIVDKNRPFFLNIYNDYTKGIINQLKLKNIIYEFIVRNAEQFNGLFTAIFNMNIENFLHELNRNLTNKILRMKTIGMQKGKLSINDILLNIETSLKSAFYMHFRHIYNNYDKYKITDNFKAAIFFFIHNNAYSGMFRYNGKGAFNVPYGGINYNRKNFTKKISYFKSYELKSGFSNTVIDNLDFEVFLDKYKPYKSDFIFLDPPYDSEFSTYTKNVFTRDDQKRLAYYLINKCNANWMLIIKKTEYISKLYNCDGLNIQSFEKKYLVSFMNRNDKNAEHLLITNYRC